jgi:putative transposase
MDPHGQTGRDGASLPRGAWPPTRSIRRNGVLTGEKQTARFAHRHNFARAVGRTGVWDNAAAKTFWATMKVGFYDRYLWPSRAAAKLAASEWIEWVYNRRRRHLALGMISPVDYENRSTPTAQAA